MPNARVDLGTATYKSDMLPTELPRLVPEKSDVQFVVTVQVQSELVSFMTALSFVSVSGILEEV